MQLPVIPLCTATLLIAGAALLPFRARWLGSLLATFAFLGAGRGLVSFWVCIALLIWLGGGLRSLLPYPRAWPYLRFGGCAVIFAVAGGFMARRFFYPLAPEWPFPESIIRFGGAFFLAAQAALYWCTEKPARNPARVAASIAFAPALLFGPLLEPRRLSSAANSPSRETWESAAFFLALAVFQWTLIVVPLSWWTSQVFFSPESYSPALRALAILFAAAGSYFTVRAGADWVIGAAAAGGWPEPERLPWRPELVFPSLVAIFLALHFPGAAAIHEFLTAKGQNSSWELFPAGAASSLGLKAALLAACGLLAGRNRLRECFRRRSTGIGRWALTASILVVAVMVSALGRPNVSGFNYFSLY